MGFLSRAAVESALSSGQNILWTPGFIMTPMALNLKQRRYVETVLAGLPHLAEAVAAIPPDWQSEAFQAAERSYLRAFRQLELSGPQTWASSVMRRLRRRVGEADKEKLTKLYEQLSANEHGRALPFGRAHNFDTHQSALSEDQKNVARELSADEQICKTHSFAIHEAALSEDQKNEARELSANEQIGEEHSFVPHDTALSEEQNVGRELSANEQIGEEHSFAPHDTALSEEQNVERELSANEQIGEEHSFATHERALSEDRNSVAREGVKKDAVALRMAKVMIRVDEIFDDGPPPMSTTQKIGSELICLPADR
jgi:hypothetical protein